MPDFAGPKSAERLVRQLLRPFRPNFAVNAELKADWKRLLAGGGFAGRLASITVPFMMMHGAGDPRPLRLAERPPSSLASARLVPIANVGHWTRPEQPEQARQALRSFLAEVRPNAASVSG